MSDKRTTPDPAEGVRRRKRPAPTIDLTATDVSAPPPEHEARTAEPPRDKGSSAEAPVSESPAGNDAKQGHRVVMRQVFFAGLGGAAIVALAFFAVWLAGLVPARYAGLTDSGRASVAELNERLAKIESAIAKLPPSESGVSERLSAADNAMKSLGIALTALTRRSDEAAARAEAADKAVTELRDSVQGLSRSMSNSPSTTDVESFQKRLAALEQSVKSTAGDKAARLALTAAALRDAVLRGTPFAAELSEAKVLGADEKQVAPLAPFAATGVPAAATLAEELRTLVPTLMKVAGTQAPGGNFLDRLQANASKLVRIRPVDAPEGDDRAAVLARIEMQAAHADIDGALTGLSKLDPATQAAARDWAAKAQARREAIMAARQFATDTTRALGKR
jgi:hypothetical protein